MSDRLRSAGNVGQSGEERDSIANNRRHYWSKVKRRGRHARRRPQDFFSADKLEIECLALAFDSA